MKSATVRSLVDETTDYAKDVASGKIPSCRYVRLACERHIRDLRRDDIWFDAAAARRFFKYCTKLSHYKGPERGKPIILEPWQRFVFGCIYGWKRVIDDERTNIWRFNIIYIEVPRKNGKTTICAAGASYDCALVEETGAEVYCLATKEDQAKLIYNDVSAYINASEELGDSFEILKGKNTIFATESHRTSFIKPLGADSQRLDGLNPLAAYADELHAWPHRELWDVFEDAFGARNQWHMVAITTAGNNREGICWEQRDQLIEILEQKIDNDNKFGVIYTVDNDQKENWQEERNWYIANPNLGTGKMLGYMQAKMLNAKQMPSSLNAFLNKQLNIWTDVAEAWLDTDQWNLCGRKYTKESLYGKRCIAAVDLARVNDLSAVAYVFPKQQGLDKLHVWVDYYLPEAGILVKAHRDKVPYSRWNKEGWITLTPGKSTDFEFIRRDINANAKAGKFKIVEITYDRHFAGELVTNLTHDGFLLEETGMGFLSMAYPTGEVERMVVAQDMCHPCNPILTWNAGNVVISKDAAGNTKPDKELSIKRIDGAVAVIMGVGRIPHTTFKPSIYETRGIVMLGTKK